MKNIFFVGLTLVFLCFRITPVTAQLPAERESHHTIVFENKDIRILEGRVPPHDTTVAHTHSANGVVVFLSPSRFAIQPVGGQPVISSVQPGDLKYVTYGDKPVNHLVWAEGEPVFHFFVVELKGRQGAMDTKPLPDQAGCKFLWQQPLVGAYSVELGKGEGCRIPSADGAYLVIAISGGGKISAAGKSSTLQVNGFRFFPAHTALGIETDGKEGVRCVLLAVKAN